MLTKVTVYMTKIENYFLSRPEHDFPFFEQNRITYELPPLNNFPLAKSLTFWEEMLKIEIFDIFFKNYLYFFLKILGNFPGNSPLDITTLQSQWALHTITFKSLPSWIDKKAVIDELLKLVCQMVIYKKKLKYSFYVLKITINYTELIFEA